MSALEEHLSAGVASVCRAWVLTRNDGLTVGFTDHDLDLVVAGVTCHAASGLTAGAIQASTGLSVDNSEIRGALIHDAISDRDIRAGRWDAAEITAYIVNWNDNDQSEIVFRGSLGEISWKDGAFSAELRGLAEGLNAVRGRVFQARCDAVLGDGRCGKVLGLQYTTDAVVESVEDGRLVSLRSVGDYADGWFARGEFEVLSGQAAGIVERIKTDGAKGGQRRIELWKGLRVPLAPGDRVRIVAGCDRTRDTCRTKFDNLLNFRGFADIPGEDWLMAYPTRNGRNDGGQL